MEVKLKPDQETHLHQICERLGVSVNDFVRRAVLTYMEDTEDVMEADEIMQRVHRGEEKTYSLEEIERMLGPKRTRR